MLAAAGDPQHAGEAQRLWQEHQEFRAAFSSAEEARAIKEMLPGGAQEVLALAEQKYSLRVRELRGAQAAGIGGICGPHRRGDFFGRCAGAGGSGCGDGAGESGGVSVDVCGGGEGAGGDGTRGRAWKEEKKREAGGRARGRETKTARTTSGRQDAGAHNFNCGAGHESPFAVSSGQANHKSQMRDLPAANHQSPVTSTSHRTSILPLTLPLSDRPTKRWRATFAGR